MAKTSVAAILLAAVVAGCGGSDASKAMADACIKEGDLSEKMCRCVASRATKELSRDAQALIVAEIEEDQARVEELSKKLTMEESAKAGIALMGAMSSCATELGEQ